MVEKIRKVDIEKDLNLDPDQLSQDISKKIRNIVDEAVEESNKLLKIYGLTSKMQIVIEESKIEDK